jgi:hypothetical protein
MMSALGLMPDHRILKRALNVLFIGYFVGWVVNGVFDVDYTVALTIIWSSIAIRFLIQLLMHPAILPLRQKIDAKYPKPFAAYR